MDIEVVFWTVVAIVVLVGALFSIIFPNKLKHEHENPHDKK